MRESVRLSQGTKAKTGFIGHGGEIQKSECTFWGEINTLAPTKLSKPIKDIKGTILVFYEFST